jgi:CTP:molybdopterin cytidylyltransferase MocA
MPGEMDAVILAGGWNRIPLFPGDRPGWKALLSLGGRTFLQHALAAATGAHSLRRLTVVGPPEVCAAARREVECRTLDASESLLANIRHGIAAVETHRAFFITADVPLVQAPMLDDFAERSHAAEGDLIASVVNRQNLGPYTATHKPFIRLADGAYQHGNLFVIPRASLLNERAWRPLDRLYRARKNGLRTASVLGPALLWWFFWDVLVLHRPTLHEAAEHVSRTVGARISLVESPHPEIMLDIDEPEDYRLAQQFLGGDPEAVVRAVARG